MLLLCAVAALSCCSSGADADRVALTFDDGPDAAITAQILDLLAAYDAKGTFFMVGQHVAASPQTAARVVAGGHEVGNHSYSHRDFTKLSEDAACAEISAGEEAIFAATGVRTTLLRPPYAGEPSWLASWAAANRYRVVEADIWGLDWELRTAQEIADTVLAKVYPGAIILLHDGVAPGAAATQTHRTVTVDATRILLEELHRRHYKLVTVSDL